MDKLYSPTAARYTFHDFKSGRYVDAIHGNERAAEAHAIDIYRRSDGRSYVYYKAA